MSQPHAPASPPTPTKRLPPSLAGLRPRGVSPLNPKVRTVVCERPKLGGDVTYLPAIVTGLALTIRRFFQNLFFRQHTATVPYPEAKVTYPPRFRALHRLMLREPAAEGAVDPLNVRCVACMMCPTICPARCITIVPGERPDSHEKYPVIFEIDELRCVVCGLCVESCPCDAIRMDTGIHMFPTERRADAILGKAALLEHGTPSTAVQGGAGPDWREREHLEFERGPESNVPATPR